ncbi:hypothetical protein [Rhabdaerophilum calidifontis]|uniref:hypothetical protein n=1 Tax=Rhabdaerophilum calidifontis TaxID=2604328 RepID=UPI0014099E00|nr:hypothetical protein [Rhabdaerophilum calidifontis]
MSVDLPGLNAGMNASIAAFKAAAQMMQQTAALVAGAATTPEARSALPYSRLLDKLA